MISPVNATPGSALILSAGDSESFRESRTFVLGQQLQIAERSDKSSSPQNAATSTLQACAPQKKCSSSRGDSSAQIKNGHAYREAIGDLIEDHALQPVGDFAIDLNAAVDRSGMHD